MEKTEGVVRPLSGLKQTKDGKLNFLEENQAVYHWAAELNSPFLYRRANDGVSEWNTYGILDGFLAAELRKYAGSCGIITAWPKRRKDPDNRTSRGP